MRKDPELWHRIAGEALPWRAQWDAGAEPPRQCASFADCLALDGGWTEASAAMLEAEYRRFAYLICVTGAPLAPPPVLEEVFRLHLDLGAGMELHAAPGLITTMAGLGRMSVAERRAAYRRARDAYQHCFGTRPPRAVWPWPWALRMHEWFDRFGLWVVLPLALALMVPYAFAALAWLASWLPGLWGQWGREVQSGDVMPGWPFVLFLTGLFGFICLALLGKIAPQRLPKRGDD